MALLTPFLLLLSQIQAHPLLTFILLPTLYLVSLSIYRIFFHPLSHIPGPLLAKLTPLYLHYQTYQGTESTTLHALHSLYSSPLIRIAPNQLSVSSPSAIQQIYVSGGGFPKSPCYRNFDIDGHATIFSETDAEKRNARGKAVMGLFSTGALREGRSRIEKVVEEFVVSLEGKRGVCQARNESLGGDSEEAKAKVNILPLTRSLAIDVVSTHLFGRTYGAGKEKGLGIGGNAEDKSVSESKPSSDADLKRAEAGEAGEEELSIAAFVDLFVGVGRFFYLPTWLFVWVEWGVDLIWGDEKTRRSMQIVDDFVEEVVTGVEQDMASEKTSGEKRQDTFPGRLLTLGLSRDEVKAQCKDLIFAGTDSTGMNLATALRQLALHPKVLSKLEEELAANKTLSEEQGGQKDIQSLPYLSGAVKESLRLSMANPTRLLHRVPPGTQFVVDGIAIPAGTDLGCQAYTLHLDEAVFPDPWAFKPERWMDSEDSSIQGGSTKEQRDRMTKSWFAFGAGSRACIARNLATMELFMGIAAVVERGVLRGAKVGEEEVRIWEWFNSRVKGECVGLVWE